MHIALDVALDIIDANPMNRLDPGAKDLILNKTIDNFVDSVIAKANMPDENKRVPFRILTYGDILAKYNDLYTLITIEDNVLPQLPIANSFSRYTLPTNLFKFETSYSVVRPLDCITYPAATRPTVALSGTAGNINNGIHHYIVTFMYGTVETDFLAENAVPITVVNNTINGQVNLTNIPVGGTGCIARKIYRTRADGNWYDAYLVTTLNDNTTTIFTDNLADSSLTTLYSGNQHDTELPNVLVAPYDIIAFNQNPFGGKKKYIGTVVERNGLRLYNNNRYAISRLGLIYIRRPAILNDVPTNCDLPDSVHNLIVDNAAKYIAAAVAAGTYEQLLMESKTKNQ